jgi:hypothetical protein
LKSSWSEDPARILTPNGTISLEELEKVRAVKLDGIIMLTFQIILINPLLLISSINGIAITDYELFTDLVRLAPELLYTCV